VTFDDEVDEEDDDDSEEEEDEEEDSEEEEDPDEDKELDEEQYLLDICAFPVSGSILINICWPSRRAFQLDELGNFSYSKLVMIFI